MTPRSIVAAALLAVLLCGAVAPASFHPGPSLSAPHSEPLPAVDRPSPSPEAPPDAPPALSATSSTAAIFPTLLLPASAPRSTPRTTSTPTPAADSEPTAAAGSDTEIGALRSGPLLWALVALGALAAIAIARGRKPA